MEDLTKNIISAIDIGTTKIVCLIAEILSDGKVKVLGFGESESTGVKHGVVQNIPKTKEAVQKAVEQAEAQAEIKVESVYVGIAGLHIRSIEASHQLIRDNAEVEITQEEIDSLIGKMYKIQVNPGEEIIHVIPKSYVVDSDMDVEPLGMFGQQILGTFHIVIGQINSAKNIKKCINEVNNIQVNDLILEPLASSYAVVTDEEKEVGVALVDIGGGTTDIAIFHNKKIVHTAVIPFGGDVITNDVKDAFKIIEAKAELLKKQFGSALDDTIKDNDYVSIKGTSTSKPKEISVKTLAKVIRARVEEIVSFVYYQIKENIDPNDLGAGIVLTGGGALLKNLPQLIAYQTGLTVRIGTPGKLIETKDFNTINQTKYATTIGLALKGFEIEQNKERQNKESWKNDLKNEEVSEPEENKQIEDEIEEDTFDENENKKSGINFLGKIKESVKTIFGPEEDQEL